MRRESRTQLSKRLAGGLTVLMLGLTPGTVSGASVNLEPFFDQVNNPVTVAFPARRKVDATPRLPQLSSFDQAVLRTCGPIGSRVSAEKFKQLLSYYPDVLQKIQQLTGGELRPQRRNQSQFLEDLTAIWFNRQGFEHIFCGEIEASNKIGGLHFVGRYLQLQQEGIGGRLPKNTQREEVIPGVVYTMGVVIKQGNRLVKDNLKGYAYVSNAQEILIEATKAFKAQGMSQGACIYPVKDQDSRQSYKAVFVKNEEAIVTFYSDATPNGRACRS